MKELNCVKVIKLLQENRPFDGTKKVKCPPKISDVGTVVFSQENYCIVESVNQDGYTIWLADFIPEELEVIE